MTQEHIDLFVNLLINERNRMESEIADLSEKIAKAQFELLEEKEKNSFKPISNEYTIRGNETITEDGIQNYINECEATIKSLNEKAAEQQHNLEVVLKELEDYEKQKRERKALLAANTMYTLQVAYARAKGFEFVRADKMKEYLEQKKREELESQRGGQKEDAIAEDNAPKGCKKIVFSSSLIQKCPNNFHDKSGDVVTLASKYCRHKCAFIDHVDDDQEIVYCKF